MLRTISRILAMTGAFFMLSAGAQASVIYSYEGANFNTFQNFNPPAGTFDNTMNVSGNFTTAAALGSNLVNQDISALITAFTFNHDRGAVTDANGGINSFLISTDAGGDIIGWDIHVTSDWDPDNSSLGSQRYIIQTCSSCASGTARDIGQLSEVVQESPRLVNTDTAIIRANAGDWTTQRVPEPLTLSLFGLGLAGVGVFARRRVMH